MNKKNKFVIQQEQYNFPYHYLVNFEEYNNKKSLVWGVEYFAYMKKVIRIIENSYFDSLLDIGCGDGRLINYLANKYKSKNFMGVDLSKPSILLAKALNYQYDNAKFECKDFKKLNKKYDLITLIEVLEHIPNEGLESFCNSIPKKLKDNGKLIISVPSDNIKPINPKHYRHYNLNMLREHFPKMKMKDYSYVFKKGFIRKVFFEFFKRVDLNKLELFIAKKILFTATKSNGRHIVCVFQK